MKKVKDHIVAHYYSYWLSVISMFYGCQLILHPDILQTYMVYKRIRNVFDHRFIGVFFMGLGVLYVLATVLNWNKVKRLSLPFFTFIWTFFGLSFALSEPPNTVGILTLGIAAISFGISLRGDFKDG